MYNPNDEQERILVSAFKRLAKSGFDKIAAKVNELVDQGSITDEEFEKIRSVVVWGSVKGFYQLEERPRELLWNILKDYAE